MVMRKGGGGECSDWKNDGRGKNDEWKESMMDRREDGKEGSWIEWNGVGGKVSRFL